MRDRSKVELMRSLNEGIALVARSFASDPTEEQLWEFVCECGRAECREWVELDLPRYEAIRGGPGSVLAEGHFARAREACSRATERRTDSARAGRRRTARH